jgi:hypothetical protein
MIKRLGRLLCTQSREINVLNYPNHTVYAIFTNQGYVYVCKDKLTQKIEYTESPTNIIDVDTALFNRKLEMK